MRTVHQEFFEVSFPPKPAARRAPSRAVGGARPTFASWFAQQMQRNDDVGQIARDAAGGASETTFRDVIELILWAGPSFTDDDIDAAVQARREYLAVNWERRT